MEDCTPFDSLLICIYPRLSCVQDLLDDPLISTLPYFSSYKMEVVSLSIIPKIYINLIYLGSFWSFGGGGGGGGRG